MKWMVFLFVVVLGIQGQSIPELPAGPIEIHLEITLRTNSLGQPIELTSSYSDYSDSAKSLAFVKEVTQGQEVRLYYDLSVNQKFKVYRNLGTTKLSDASCQVINMANEQPIPFGIPGFSLEDGKPHLNNITLFLRSGTGAVYNGTDTVRGIPTKKWVTTFSSGGTSHVLTYWYSDNHVMPYFGTASLPVRIVINSQGQTLTYQALEFYMIASLGPAQYDASFFGTPKGVFCEGRAIPTDVTPLDFRFLAYSLQNEMVNASGLTIRQNEMYYDFELNMTRSDSWVPVGDTIYKRVKVIHDFTNGVQITVDVDTDNCTVSTLRSSGWSWDSNTDADGHVVMQQSFQTSAMQNVTYMGTRVERGITIRVWSRRNVNVASGMVRTTEIYFSQRGWTNMAGSNYSEHRVPVGMYMRFYNQTSMLVVNELNFNMYNQFSGDLDPEVFTAKECASPDALDREHIGFKVLDPAMLFSANRVSRATLYRAMRLFIAEAAMVPPTRVTNIRVYEKTDDSGKMVLNVWCTMLQKFVAQNDGSSELDNAMAVLRLQAAFLGSKVQFTVPLRDGTEGVMLIMGLLYNDENVDVVDGVTNEEQRLSGVVTYGKADMAGLGIGMLLLGAVLALLVFGVLYVKRDALNIPYLRQNNSN